MKILIADDNTDTRQLARLMLEKQGHTVETAKSGLGAIGLYELDRDFDLLLLDAVMGDPTGYEVAAHIRKSSDVPIIIMTAHNDELVAAHAEHVGANGVLLKPFDGDELCAKLVEVVSHAQT